MKQPVPTERGTLSGGTLDELLKCSRCGYCASVCPTYQATMDECLVARGRHQVLTGAVEEQSLLPAATKAPIFDCLLCGACTDVCSARVATAEVIVDARRAWHQEHGRPVAQSVIFQQILTDPQRMSRLMKLAALGKNSGLADALNSLGILKWLAPAAGEAIGMVPALPRTFLRERLASLGFVRDPGDGLPRWRSLPTPASSRAGPKVLFFVGCGTDYQLPRQGEAALRLLQTAGCEICVTENCCCGLPPYAYGDLNACRELVRQNLARFGGEEFDVVVSECGSCSSFIKKWPELVDGGDQIAAAVSVASRARDVTELLDELAFPEPVNEIGPVTYHDPCHLGRGQGIRDEPRRLLADVAGVDFCEMRGADQCCGGAGSYALTHPDISELVLGRKMHYARETGAHVLATACPGCVVQLARGARAGADGPRVLHVTEIICEALGFDLSQSD